MFKFSFDLDLDDDDETLGAVEPTPILTGNAKEQAAVPSQPFREVAFDDLFATLPPSLSYCPLPLPAHVPSSVAPIVRRDMFDAHFQLIASASEEEAEPEVVADGPKEPAETSDAAGEVGSAGPTPATWGPETDLVKGVYEGGMKTWECAGDLVGVLQAEVVNGTGWKAVEGKRIMEVGCGTAIPSIYLLQELLAKPEDETVASPPPRTAFYFLDYNELVLKLVTLPNVVLAFRHLLAPPTAPSAPSAKVAQPSSAADPNARRSTSPAPSSVDGAAADEEDDDEDDDSDSLTLTQTRLARFRELLSRRNIDLRFFAGGWDSFALRGGQNEAKMDIVLTSETVYQIANLPALVDLLRQASHPTPSSAGADAGRSTTALVAAKVLYFGLEGGGVPAFEDAVRASPDGAGWTEEVWRSESGVKRWVGRVGWTCS